MQKWRDAKTDLPEKEGLYMGKYTVAGILFEAVVKFIKLGPFSVFAVDKPPFLIEDADIVSWRPLTKDEKAKLKTDGEFDV